MASRHLEKKRLGNRFHRFLALAIVALTLAACAAAVPKEWESLLEDLRAYQRRLGFERLDSFLEFSVEGGKHTFCGQVSRLHLPYSYEDPAIRWLDVTTETECRAVGESTDVYFGTVEAMGEVGAAVTNDVLSVPLHRFVYLVLHEDCHDEFALPYGFEEALCNLVAYRGMVGFSESKYRWISRESLAIRRYAATESSQTRAVKAIYEQLAARYELHAAGQLTTEALLKERARILDRAERELQWKRGSLNNVGLANEMTYSRHYPLIEDVHAALGSDLARTLAFFKRVDAAMPPPKVIMKRRQIRSQQSVAFLRAYEDEVVRVVERLLADR
jgi:hypothetical protein